MVFLKLFIHPVRVRVRVRVHGKDSMSFLGPKIWELIPKNLREIENLKKFKSK